MTKPMRYRDVKAALLAQGCVPKGGRGDHEKWFCPCGKHIAVVKKLTCLSKGWWQ